MYIVQSSLSLYKKYGLSYPGEPNTNDNGKGLFDHDI